MKPAANTVTANTPIDQASAQLLPANRILVNNRVLALMALFLVAGGIQIFVDIYSSRQANIARLQVEVTGFTEQVVERIQNHLRPVETQSKYLATMIAAEGNARGNDTQLTDYMTAAMAGVKQVSELAFIDPAGNVTRVKRTEREVKFSDWSGDPGTRRIIATARQAKRPYWGEFFFAEPTKSTLLNFRSPIWDGNTYLGVLVSVVSITELSKFLVETSLDYSQSSFILSGAGEVLAHSNPANSVSRSLRLSDEQPLPKIYQIGDPVLTRTWADPEGRVLLKKTEAGKAGHYVTVDGKTYILFSRPLKAYGAEPWLVGLHIPISQIEKNSVRAYLTRAIAIILFLVIAIGSFYLGRMPQRSHP